MKFEFFCAFFCMLDTVRRVRVKVTLDLVTRPMNSGALFPPVFVYYRVYISLTLRLRLLPMIVKCGDDLRQEQLAYQLLLQFQVRFAVYLFWILVDCAVWIFHLVSLVCRNGNVLVTRFSLYFPVYFRRNKKFNSNLKTRSATSAQTHRLWPFSFFFSPVTKCLPCYSLHFRPFGTKSGYHCGLGRK